MESAVVLNNDDVKRIIAERFGVDENKVLRSQYTYTVVGAKGKEIFEFEKKGGCNVATMD